MRDIVRPIPRRTVLGSAAAVVAGLVAGRSGPATARPAPPRELPPLGNEFLWGVAASGFQTEGHTPDSRRRQLYIGTELDEFPDSVDFYTRYPSDIALAADLGVGVYRISVEWARLQPRPGEWDEAGFDFYDRVLDAMAAHGIRPMLALDHLVYPVWIAERGGWQDPGFVDAWLANARKVVQRYASRNPIWITFATPYGYVKFESRDTLPATEIPAQMTRIIDAHNAIYDHIHRLQPGARVTMSGGFLTGFTDDVTEGPFLRQVVDRLDFIGFGISAGLSLESLPDLAQQALFSPLNLRSPLAHAMQPESVYYALRHYARKFPGKPLYVVENSIPMVNGRRPDGYGRGDHLRDTVYWLQRARADGIDVIGYNYWGLTDSFDWGGYDLRFGLYTVDVRTDPTLTRHPTDAVAAYRAITATGGVPADYLPTRRPAFCSLVDSADSCFDPVTLPR
ncbi:family 1 glycosylhydrolase [Nocardia sp. NPDC127526]|uniref:family 1 glycosylhydrolase n=1 Tax=Nocardia sp. NPDC127526 TaxID=3345393 RepID=UPI00362EE003